MASREDRHQELIDHVVLADDDLPQLRGHGVVGLSQPLERLPVLVGRPIVRLAVHFPVCFGRGRYRHSLLPPYLSLSLKRIGLGFSVEAGDRKAEYASANSGQYNENRLATLKYRGVGAFIYLIPFDKMWNSVNTTVILGGRNYTARHQHTRTSTTAGNQANQYATTLNYSVPSYEGGLNFNIGLLKSFSMIPWGNYAAADTTNAMSQMRSDDYERDFIESDVEVFWNDKPNLTYGLDFAAKMGSFQVRLGGLLGFFAASAGSSQIKDESLSLAVSFEQKGH